MMDPGTIKAMAREAAETAAEEGMVPFSYWDVAEVDTYSGFPFPFLGEYVPDGWEMKEEHFVDASGWGSEGEAALTAGQFTEIIKERITAAPRNTVGWAVTEAGQFQVYVGEYYKTGGK